MKTKTVSDLMVPIAEYAVVTEDATLMDAVMALEKAQMEFDKSRYRHRAILVMDRNNNVVGKISQHDVIEALEPNYQKMKSREKGAIDWFVFGDHFIKSAMKEFSVWDKPLQNICEKAARQKVKDFMYMPSIGEFVGESATMDEDIHQLMIWKHHSLLVTKGKAITGVLRLTDVFEMIFNVLKKCG